METFIVIPCLNEQDRIITTCASLGFGHNRQSLGRLVLVDNGSSDKTFDTISLIQRASPPGSVLVVQEQRRGYVSARRAGMASVLDVARMENLPAESILVLQADADTLYLPGYVRTMAAAYSNHRGQLIEASAVTNREFYLRFPAFCQMCREIDAEMEVWFAPDEQQVVVDDKVCAFSLADYCVWGEHQDELDNNGKQIFAETTRLLMRAKAMGNVWHNRVEEAQALPSRRRLFDHALGYFASSGFPRHVSWMEAWGKPDESERFLVSPHSWPTLNRLVRSRQRHQLALFGLLPAIYHDKSCAPTMLSALAATLRETLGSMSPGVLLGLMLTMADEEDGPLADLLCNI